MDLSDPQSGEMLANWRSRQVEIRARELNVPLQDFRDWLSGKRVESVEAAMLRETDDMDWPKTVRGRS